MADRITIYRGDLPITVKEFRELLDKFSPESEVIFKVDITSGNAYPRVESIDEWDNGAAFVELGGGY